MKIFLVLHSNVYPNDSITYGAFLTLELALNYAKKNGPEYFNIIEEFKVNDESEENHDFHFVENLLAKEKKPAKTFAASAGLQHLNPDSLAALTSTFARIAWALRILCLPSLPPTNKNQGIFTE